MKYVRKSSCTELLYNDMQDVMHTYASQYVMKIKTLNDEKKLEEAINSAIRYNSGTNMSLKGRRLYDAEKAVKIKHVTVKEKDLFQSDFLNGKIDFRSESVQAFIVRHGGDKYFVIRVSHAVMDGKGGMMLIENIFNCMNRKKMMKYDNLLTERELVKRLPHRSKRESKIPKLQPINARRIEHYTPRRRVLSLTGYSEAIVAKLARIFADEFEETEVRLMIPCDLRRHCKGERHCGNLVLPIMLRVNKEDDVQAINGKLLMGLKNKDELNIRNTSYYCYNYLPGFVRHLLIKTMVLFAKKTRRFSIAGVISYLGKVDFEVMQSKNLRISSFISIPPAEPLGPFVVLITEYNNTTQIAISYYEKQYTEKYMDHLCKKIREAINE